MIKRGTLVVVADNSGAKKAEVFGIRGGTRRDTVSIGDIVKVAIKEVLPNGKIKKGEVKNALIIRTKYPVKFGNKYTRFNDNAVVILDEKGQPVGTIIHGDISEKLVKGKNRPECFAAVASACIGGIF